MKVESAVFLNPNQEILIHEMQKEVCAKFAKKNPKKEKVFCLPILPICITNEDLHENAKISKASPRNIFINENKIFLKIEMEIDGNESFGKIELCKQILKTTDSSKGFLLKNDDFSEIFEKFSEGLKKISPFRLVQIEKEEYENGVAWKIKSEKWGKIQ